MRFAGRLTEWNDDKGFGFVVPNGGGERAFVHIKAFQRGSRRPVVGDLISYLPGKDERGRTQAREIRHAGQKAEARRQPSRLPRRSLGLAALVAAVLATLTGYLPPLLAAIYLGASALSWLMYYFDKVAAGRGAQRTPEATLHLVDLLGGWPGGLLAQQQFRHKTVKSSFQAVFWITVLGNLAAVAWLVRSGLAAALSTSLTG